MESAAAVCSSARPPSRPHHDHDITWPHLHSSHFTRWPQPNRRRSPSGGGCAFGRPGGRGGSRVPRSPPLYSVLPLCDGTPGPHPAGRGRAGGAQHRAPRGAPARRPRPRPRAAGAGAAGAPRGAPALQSERDGGGRGAGGARGPRGVAGGVRPGPRAHRHQGVLRRGRVRGLHGPPARSRRLRPVPGRQRLPHPGGLAPRPRGRHGRGPRRRLASAVQGPGRAGSGQRGAGERAWRNRNRRRRGAD